MFDLELAALDAALAAAVVAGVVAHEHWLLSRRHEARRALLQRFAARDLDLAAYEREVAELDRAQARRGLHVMPGRGH